ncbi:MAG: hypothetical protein JXR37_06680 [Kiritimatiellae bacterium]|nr:hypothetical protein [Kiritimatiellia bacterium]
MKRTETNENLPQSLLAQFRALEGRLFAVETLMAAAGALCGALASYLLIFGADRLGDVPRGFRMLLGLASAVCVAGFALFWLRRWGWARRDLCALARIVQRRHRALGDELLGAVELSDTARRPPNVSAALCEAAIRQVAAEAAVLDFASAVRKRLTRRLVLAALCLAALAGALGMALPQPSLNALARWALPFLSIERYTFVRLLPLPQQMIVPHGEEFAFRCRLAQTTKWRPAHMRYQCTRQVRGTAPFIEKEASVRIPGLTAPAELRVRAGDAVAWTRIRPELRPALLNLRATVERPAYLQLPPHEADVWGQELACVEGSRVTLRGEVSRDLAAAALDAGRAVPLAVTGSRFASPQLDPAELRDGLLSWTDVLGLKPRRPYPVLFRVAKDGPPFVDCPQTALYTAMLSDETLNVTVEAQDDFGVRNVAVEWEAVEPGKEGTVGVRYTETVAEGGPDAVALAGQFMLSPAELGARPGMMILFRAVAVDRFPGRNPSVSPEYRVYVLTWSQHVELLQERLDLVLEALEELTRKEEGLLEANRALDQLPDDKLAGDEAAKELEQHEQAESESAAELEKQIEAAAEIMKDALRNREFPLDTLAELSRLSETMQAIAQQEMKEAIEALQRAQADAAQRRAELAKAMENQQKILDALKNLQKKSHSLQDNVTARNFVNRLRELAGRETAIAARFKGLVEQTVGFELAELPDDLKTAVTTLQEEHDDIRKTAKYIKDDIQGYFNRTRLEPYETVHLEMEKKKLPDALESLSGTIGKNRTFLSIAGTVEWAQAFLRWAEFLAKQGCGAPAGSGAPGEMTAEQLELILRLMRLVQNEEKLRDRTRLLEEQKTTLKDYPARAGTLGGVQVDIRGELDQIDKKVGDPDSKALLLKARTAMNDAERLLRVPKTDAETIAAETEVIELLTRSAMSSAGQMSAFMQGFLAQMMGQMGRMGGGSLAGGAPDGSRPDMNGRADGGAGSSRAGQRTSGGDVQSFPFEFREALEAYFREIGK